MFGIKENAKELWRTLTDAEDRKPNEKYHKLIQKMFKILGNFFFAFCVLVVIIYGGINLFAEEGDSQRKVATKCLATNCIHAIDCPHSNDTTMQVVKIGVQETTKTPLSLQTSEDISPINASSKSWKVGEISYWWEEYLTLRNILLIGGGLLTTLIVVLTFALKLSHFVSMYSLSKFYVYYEIVMSFVFGGDSLLKQALEYIYGHFT